MFWAFRRLQSIAYKSVRQNCRLLYGLTALAVYLQVCSRPLGRSDGSNPSPQSVRQYSRFLCGHDALADHPQVCLRLFGRSNNSDRLPIGVSITVTASCMVTHVWQIPYKCARDLSVVAMTQVDRVYECSLVAPPLFTSR